MTYATDTKAHNVQNSKKTNSENNPEKEENIMSENVTTEATTETAPVETTEISAPEIAPVVEETPEETSNPNREAAKYRHQAREAEAARDALTLQLSAAREQIVAAALTAGVTLDALKAGGHTVEELFTDTGALNTEALNTASTDVTERFNIRRPVPYSSAIGRANTVTLSDDNNWESAFKHNK